MPSGAANNPWIQIGARSDAVPSDVPAQATLAQEQVETLVGGIQDGTLGGASQPRPVPASQISLPSYMSALWWPLNDGAGSTVVDRVHGLSAGLIGTLTNVWANPGQLTLAADVAARVLGATQLSMFDMTELTGSIIVGIDIEGPVTSGSPVAYAWGVGDMGQATGGLAGVVNNVDSPLVAYRGVSGPLTLATTILAGNLQAQRRRMYHWVFHRNLLDSRVYVEGYVDGWQSRGIRITGIEGAESPPIDISRGLRIAGRPTGPSGTANFYGASGAGGNRLSNFHAIRLDGDYRHKIPGWLNNIAAVMPYGGIPEVFNHG